MINQTSLSGKLATDVKDLGELRQTAKQNSPEALKTAAKQFEALFMNMVMKSRREATPQDGPFDSQQSKMFTSMLDQQLSQTMATRGVGLADVLIRQLSNNAMNQAVQETPASKVSEDILPGVNPSDASGQDPLGLMHSSVPNPMQLADPAASKWGKAGGKSGISAAPISSAHAPATISSTSSQRPHIRAFHDRMSSEAQEASSMTGIPAKFMIAQAALESGWGKREIMAADGSPSHNLFGIKASGGWTGKVVERATTEYVNGVPQTKMEKFRAYDSYAEGFRDYASLLSKNPRYQNVIANAQDVNGFAKGLQRAGYATDPNYAAKLTRIIKQNLA
ncbi:flagellar assembly peptidoglycan hydrolase FlgJ [soil metagenome]